MTIDTPPEQGSPHLFWQFLNARREQISQAIFDDCRAQIDLYAQLPAADALRSLNATVAKAFDALDQQSFEPLLNWVSQVMALRFQQGLDLDQGLLLPIIFRKHFVAFSIDATAQQIPGAGPGILFLSGLCDAVAQRMVGFYRERLRTFEALIENAVDGIAVADPNNKLTYASPAFRRLTGYDDAVGSVSTMLVEPEDRERLEAGIRETFAQGAWRGVLSYRRQNGERFSGQLTTFVIGEPGQAQARGIILRDVSEQQRAEQERIALQEELIAAQQAAIRELSTPLIPLAEGLVAMPLVGAIDSARAQQIMETLLEGIATQQAEVALLDITGVRVVDTQIANTLLRAAQSAKLLGARVVLTGISSEVAQTLVGLGADLSGITTRGTLRDGIAFAMQQVD